LTVKGVVTDNGVAGTAVLDNTRVNAIYLYNNGSLIATKSASELDAAGAIEFDNIDIKVAKNTAQNFSVKLDIIDDNKQAGDTIQMQVTNYDMVDEDGDNIAVTAPLPTSDRVITIKGVGTLTVAVDNTDSETDKAKHVLGGELSPFVASYEVVANNEAIKIKDLQVIATETAGHA